MQKLSLIDLLNDRLSPWDLVLFIADNCCHIGVRSWHGFHKANLQIAQEYFCHIALVSKHFWVEI
jgi:hypothetical protein